MAEINYLNFDWNFYKDLELKEHDEKIEHECVDLPHSYVSTPFNYFDESIYQGLMTYSRFLPDLSPYSGKILKLTVDGAAHKARIYVNGNLIAEHKCADTAFDAYFKITDKGAKRVLAKNESKQFFESTDIGDNFRFGKLPEIAASDSNYIAIVINSHEDPSIPPFGHVVDYMTYGGLTRGVSYQILESDYIDHVFAKPVVSPHVKLSDSGKITANLVSQLFIHGESMLSDLKLELYIGTHRENTDSKGDFFFGCRLFFNQ